MLVGLAALAAGAAVFFLTRSSERKHGVTAGHLPVHMTAVATYDPPPGDGHEHDEAIAKATDGNRDTFWTTEHYNGDLQKSGVGIVLDARRTRTLERVTLVTDTPGYSALIKGGPSSSGPFTPVSGTRVVGSTTTFFLHGNAAHYYLVWITDLGGQSSVHVNEVRARS